MFLLIRVYRVDDEIFFIMLLLQTHEIWFFLPAHRQQESWCPAGGNSADAPSWIKSFIRSQNPFGIFWLVSGKAILIEITSWQDISPKHLSSCPPAIQCCTFEQWVVDSNWVLFWIPNYLAARWWWWYCCLWWRWWCWCPQLPGAFASWETGAGSCCLSDSCGCATENGSVIWISCVHFYNQWHTLRIQIHSGMLWLF